MVVNKLIYIFFTRNRRHIDIIKKLLIGNSL